MDKPNTSVSKFLSYILRHHPEAIGLTLDGEGWADVDELLVQAAAHGRNISLQLLHEVVATNNKKRFSLSADGRKIRAEQGHSTAQVDIAYTETEPPEILYHGTAQRFAEAIEQQGLLPGSRHYVHLSGDVETAVSVGSRHGKPLVLEVQAGLMRQQGFVFYLTANKVWLIKEVPPQFLRRM